MSEHFPVDDESLRAMFFRSRDAKKKAQHEQICATFYDAARVVRDLCPPGYLRELALSNLLEACALCNSAAATAGLLAQDSPSEPTP